MGSSRQEYLNGLPLPSPGDHLNPGIKPGAPVSPASQVDSLLTEPSGKLHGLFNEDAILYALYGLLFINQMTKSSHQV